MSETAFWGMLPREFARRVEAWEEAERTRWERQILLVNTIRGVHATEDIEPLTYEDLLEDEYEPPSAEEWAADRERILNRQ